MAVYIGDMDRNNRRDALELALTEAEVDLQPDICDWFTFVVGSVKKSKQQAKKLISARVGR